jgi:nucleoside-diphosphate-sugar epimerase
MDDGAFEGNFTRGDSLRIVVTGCTGFIGSHIVPALTKAGYDVTGTVEPGGASGSADVTVHNVDIRTGDGLALAFTGADAVIHLAARNHVLWERSKDPLSEYRKVNVEGTRNVLWAASAAGAHHGIAGIRGARTAILHICHSADAEGGFPSVRL